jgi:molybdopterin converting factor small subunit
VPKASLELPSLIASVLGGVRTITVEGDTLRAALEDAFRQQPALRVRLCDESGRFRQHVLCFHNDVSTRWMEDLDGPIRDGDIITILQAVSGG